MTARRHVRVLVGVTCALVGLATTATARPAPVPDPLVGDDLVVATDPVVVVPPDPVVVATDPVVVATDPQPAVIVEPVIDPVPQPEMYVPDHGPYALPVDPPPRESPRESTYVMGSATQAWMSERDGVGQLGRGGTLSFGFLQRRGDMPTGVELSGVFLHGDRASVYDLSLRLIASPKIGDRTVVPFIAMGLAVGASRLVSEEAKAFGEDASFGFSIGPSAALGLHGFLGDKTYWRAGAGFLGAGLGAYTADIGIGFVVD